MVVRMRHTRAHTRNRRSHHAVSKPTVSVDSKNGSVHMRHRMSPVTGTYKGRQIIDVASKLLKKDQKKQAKKEASK